MIFILYVPFFFNFFNIISRSMAILFNFDKDFAPGQLFSNCLVIYTFSGRLFNFSIVYIKKSVWLMILSSVPYFNIFHPNATSLSCKGRPNLYFCIFCIKSCAGVARLKLSTEHGAMSTVRWAWCDEHVTVKLVW